MGAGVATSCCCNGVHTDINDLRAGPKGPSRDILHDREGAPQSPVVEGLPKEVDEVPAVLCLSRGHNGERAGSSDCDNSCSDAFGSASPVVKPESPEEIDIKKPEQEEEEDTVGPLPGPEPGADAEGAPKKNADRPANKQLRRNLTTQAAGHGGDNILKDWTSTEAIPQFIIKQYDAIEAKNYEKLQSTEDPLRNFTPRYDGEQAGEENGENVENNGKPQRYMRLSNCLLQFARGPHVMDCKLGTRSFAESEVSNKALRADLYKKMKDLAPKELTPEEDEAGAITKHRWMVFNDNFTSLASLGFRIDGICCTRENGERGEVTKKDLKALRTNQDCAKCIVSNFLPTARVPEEQKFRADVAELILGQLQELRESMKQSEFVATHSLVGASLLFVADAHGPKGDVFLIDFAKTMEVPEGISVDHVSPWQEGNHEDGIFLGIDNMIKVWTEVLNQCKGKQKKKFWPVRKMWKP